MRAHYLQHVPFEGLGSIDPWLKEAGYDISNTQFFHSFVFPKINDIDLLVVMGGPMSVNDEKEHPWLVEEKKFIRKVIEAEKPVLGICLGAQLIANSMGGEVFPHSEKEIGWFPVEAVEPDSPIAFRFPEETFAFHWHGETFNLPKGSVKIAKSKGCQNQAFQIGRNVIGLQFHLETTPESARAMVENCRGELVPGRYIQSEVEILSAPKGRYSSINRLMSQILDYLHPSQA